MKKLMTIIGARPQIIKSAAISRVIRQSFASQLAEVIVHTGQHYDKEMSGIFFEELNIPQPDYNLNIGSASHAVQTAEMIRKIEEVLQKEQPDAVLVYGDTNSTLAAAIVVSKTGIPLVHVEAGLRSYNKKMPEEINRILCDHVATLLFSPTPSGVDNLKKEGFKIGNLPPYGMDNPKIYSCGDIMYDNSLYFSTIAKQKSTIISSLNLEKRSYFLSTVHRPSNTDSPEKLTSILEAFLTLTKKYPNHSIVVPLHPRTKKCLKKNISESLQLKIKENKNIQIIPPVSFLDIIALEESSDLILTDSGGLQKEAYFFKKPCVILREETEWVEIVENGTALVSASDLDRILKNVDQLMKEKNLVFPPLFGDGKAAEFIVQKVLSNC